MLRILSLLSASYLIAAPALGRDDDEFPWLNERKILGTNDLEPIEATVGTAVYDYARAVARVEVIEDAYPYCTATRVGEGIFLTNWHCDHGCETMQFRLGYEKNLPASEQRIYRCTAMLKKSENLDYSIFRAVLVPDAPTVPTPGSEPESIDLDKAVGSYPILSLAAEPLAVGQAVMVPQHPTGRFKEVDRSADCVISDIVPFHTESGRDTIKHLCDTQGGSSGAPVIDQATGHVVALHWGGRDDEFNMAIPMNLIIADLQASLAPEALSEVAIFSPAAAGASSEARSQP